jgi:lipopolysaccharide biosynthesis regulator YciM
MTESTTTYMIAAILVLVAFAIALTVTVRGGRNRRRRREDPYVAGLRRLLDGDRSGAYSSLQSSVKSGQAPNDAYIRLGAMLRENGDPAKALQMHRSLTVKTDLSKREKVELFTNIALDYSAQGNATQAANVLETAVQSMGLKDPEVYRLLAREYLVLGQTESSYRCLKEMKRLGAIGDRELSLFLCTAGDAAAEKGDLKEAKKIYQKALKHQSDNPVALLGLGDLEEKLDNLNESLDRWKTAAIISQELSTDALKKVEHVMFDRGMFGDMERVYRDILQARPWDEYATIALASFFKKQGRGEDAVEFLEEFREMHPESIGATVLLTSLYASMGDRDRLDTFLEELESKVNEAKVHFECAKCGYRSQVMRWHCPRCNIFDSFEKKHED